MKKFSNYQIEVQLENGPKETEIATVILSGDLAETTGWKKRVFICKVKEVVAGLKFIPIHHTTDQIEFYARNDSTPSFEIQLNAKSIRLFRQRWPGITRWLKKWETEAR